MAHRKPDLYRWERVSKPRVYSRSQVRIGSFIINTSSCREKSVKTQARSRGGVVGRPPPPQLPLPKILFHPLAWGPIKVTIPSSYRWKYAPLWLINHPRRLELDSLFLPWYRQPSPTIPCIVFQWRIQGGWWWQGPITPPPPLGMWMTSHGQCPRGGCLWMSKSGGVFNFSEGGWRDVDNDNVQGGVLVNIQVWGCFSIFWRADDVTRTMSKGGACECPRVGVFSIFRRADDMTWTMSKGGACEYPSVGVFFNFLEGGWRHADNVQGGMLVNVFTPPLFRKSCICACVPPMTPPPPPHLDGWLRAWDSCTVTDRPSFNILSSDYTPSTTVPVVVNLVISGLKRCRSWWKYQNLALHSPIMA